MNREHLAACILRSGVSPAQTELWRPATLRGYRLRTYYLTASGWAAANIESCAVEMVEGVAMQVSATQKAISSLVTNLTLLSAGAYAFRGVQPNASSRPRGKAGTTPRPAGAMPPRVR